MSVINFKKANCRNCYKCIRFCPVKAIKVNNEQAEIIEHKCIACGRCLNVCPQNAKTIRSDIEKVKHFIDQNYKVIFTVAPSYPALVGYDNAFKFLQGLKLLGATEILETSIGAELVSNEYQKYYYNDDFDNLITTSCTVVNYFIQKYYPELINCLVPVVSPMIALGKAIKSAYNEEIKIVFIGPCLAKKVEMNDFGCEDAIDAVLTFEEIIDWFNIENIDINCLEDYELITKVETNANLYPIEGKTIECIGIKNNTKKRMEVTVSSLEEIKDLLEDIKSGIIHGYWIEANACKGSCINGPAFGKLTKSIVKRREDVINYSKLKLKVNCKNNVIININNKIDLGRRFINLSDKVKIPAEEEIRDILSRIGKFTKDDELNCGACGYESCREKAIAVYNKMAELYMCMPYMRSRAETLSNIIISSTPNAIIAVNKNLEIQEMNRAAEKMFLVNSSVVKNEDLSILIDTSDFEYVIKNKKNICNKKVTYKNYGVVAIQNIYYLEEYQLVIGIFTDITELEKQRQTLSKVKKENYELAQQVINKQMRVAQEIASLLGETTAETKVILTRMKDMLLDNMGDIK